MSLSYRAQLAKRSLARISSRLDRPLDPPAGDVVPFDRSPIDAARARMEKIDRLPRPRRVDYLDTLVGGVPAIIATPTDVPPERHLLYIHGGGYVVGSPRSHIAMVANLAKRAAATATVIEYRLAPEHPYPAAVDDSVAAYRSMCESGVDPSRITIAGDSAGGGATVATLCALRDGGDPLPGACYLLSPWTDLTASGESITTKAEVDPMFDGTGIREVGRAYAGDTPLDDPGVSPLFADLTGLPPMLIQTGVDEVLLSDSTRLADRARDAGVDVTLDLAEGMWHVYQMFAPLVPEATAALVRAACFMRSRIPADLVAARS
jgi:acetyl esterase/lipase